MRLDLEPAISPPSLADAPPSPSVLDDNQADVRELLAQGIRSAQSGNRAKARIALQRVVALEPRNESAWLWLASISEYPEELLVFLTNVLDVNPNNQRAIEWSAATRSLLSKTFVQRGIDAAEEKKPDYAAQCFNQALEYDQNNAMAWLWMASLADDPEGKIAYFEKVLAIEPANETALAGFAASRHEIRERQLGEARAAAVDGRIGDANEFLDAIIAENPNCEEAWTLRAHLADGFDGRIAAFEKVLQINPDNVAARAAADSLRSIIATVMPPAPEPVAPAEESVVFEAPAPEPEPAFAEFTTDKSPTQDLELPAGFAGFSQSPSVEEEAPAAQASTPFAEPAIGFDTIFVPAEVNNAEFAPAPQDAVFDDVSAADEFSNEDEADAAEELPAFSYEAIDLPPAAEAPVEYANGGEHSHVEDHAFDAAEPQLADDAVAVASDDQTFAPFAPAENVAEFASHLQPAVNNYRPEVPAPGVSVVSVAAGNSFAHVAFCPFCNGENEAQSVSCQTCMAVLTLSDLEMLINNSAVDKLMLRDAVERMERERMSREFSESELTMLGIAHLNLRNLQYGFNYLQQASIINPNNVVLGSQVNVLHIRLEEIKRREEVQDTMTKGKTILVVDDSPTVRKLITGKLEKSGHEVFCANDGVEAIDLLENLDPDLVLLDINMPRMDGYQVCKSIRSNPATKDVPVVMISGKDGFFDKVRGRMAGTTGYITKPFGPETLMKAVEAYLGEAEKNEHGDA